MIIDNEFISSLKPSAIRSVTGKIDEKKLQGVYFAPFAGGRPDKKTFPMEELAKITSEIFENNDGDCVQYEATTGFPPLRKALAELMQKFGVTTEAENILPFSGSTQALAYISRALLTDSDGAVICESPTYCGAIDIFKSYSKNVIGVPMDDEGILPDKLEEALKENAVKFIYVIPDYQNPSGSVMSIDRRKAVIELARKYDVILVEDAPYSLLGFDRTVPVSIKSMDTEDRVIYIGSFSKTIAPGLRVGWMNAEKNFIKKMGFLKTIDDLQGNDITQRMVYRYITEYDFDAHVNAIRDMYKEKAYLMADVIKKSFPKETKIIEPRGGMFLWVELEKNIDAEAFFNYAFSKNIAFIPGSYFYVDNPERNTIRFNFSMPTLKEIEEKMSELGHLLHEFKESN